MSSNLALRRAIHLLTATYRLWQHYSQSDIILHGYQTRLGITLCHHNKGLPHKAERDVTSHNTGLPDITLGSMTSLIRVARYQTNVWHHKSGLPWAWVRYITPQWQKSSRFNNKFISGIDPFWQPGSRAISRRVKMYGYRDVWLQNKTKHCLREGTSVRKSPTEVGEKVALCALSYLHQNIVRIQERYLHVHEWQKCSFVRSIWI